MDPLSWGQNFGFFNKLFIVFLSFNLCPNWFVKEMKVATLVLNFLTYAEAPLKK